MRSRLSAAPPTPPAPQIRPSKPSSGPMARAATPRRVTGTRIASGVASALGNSLSANARAALFAQLNVALADAAIACWDVKYTYGGWRPETAINLADTDGNDATSGRCRLAFPAHQPEPSGLCVGALDLQRRRRHRAGCRLRRQHCVLDHQQHTLPGVTRNFTSFSQARGRSRAQPHLRRHPL